MGTNLESSEHQVDCHPDSYVCITYLEDGRVSITFSNRNAPHTFYARTSPRDRRRALLALEKSEPRPDQSGDSLEFLEPAETRIPDSYSPY